MNDYKTIHEAYWEAIRVEHMLKWPHLQKVKCQKEKSPQTTKANVVGPLAITRTKLTLRYKNKTREFHNNLHF